MKIFGRNLRTARLHRGLTQQSMAESLGVSLRTYIRYEQGETEPAMDTLVEIMAILDVTADWLLCSDGEAPAD